MLVTGRDMVVDVVEGSCLLFVHTKNAPTDEDCGAVAKLWRSHDLAKHPYKCLVVTDGGSPTGQQRKTQLAEHGHLFKKMPTAVISDGSIIRFVVSSLALFTPTIRSFEASKVDEALMFIDVSSDARRRIASALLKIQERVPRGRFLTLENISMRLKALT